MQIAVVTFEASSLATAYVRQAGLPWPVLVDRDRSLYRSYGMERGTVWNVFGPRSWSLYVRLLLRGRKLRWTTGDVRQLGGDVLIDPDRVVRLHHVGSGPADRPDVRSLLDVVRRQRRLNVASAAASGAN